VWEHAYDKLQVAPDKYPVYLTEPSPLPKKDKEELWK